MSETDRAGSVAANIASGALSNLLGGVPRFSSDGLNRNRYSDEELTHLNEQELANRRLHLLLSKVLTKDQQKSIFGLQFVNENNEETDQAVFGSRDVKTVWGTSAIATAYLNLKASNDLVLGDSVGVSMTRGNIYNVNLAYSDDEPLLKYPASAGTLAAPSVGPKIISISGISKQGDAASMGEVTLEEQDLYKDTDLLVGDEHEGVTWGKKKGPLRDENGHIVRDAAGNTVMVDLDAPPKVNLGYVKKPNLVYGTLSVTSSEMIVKSEWLDSGNNYPNAEKCDFSNLTIYSKNGLDGSGSSDAVDIPLALNAVGSEQSKKFFGANGMQGYDKVRMPGKLAFHIAASFGDVSNAIYTKGKGRVNIDEMEGTSKTITYAKESHLLYYAYYREIGVHAVSEGANNFAVQFLKTEFRAISAALTVNLLDSTNAFGTVKLGASFFSLDVTSDASAKLKTALGPSFRSRMAIRVETEAAELKDAIAHMAKTEMSLIKNNLVIASRDIGLQQTAIRVLRTDLDTHTGDIDIHVHAVVVHA